MRRLALLLATAVLGTGCVVTSDDGGGPSGYGTVNLYWDFARRAPAQPGGFIYYDQSHAGSGTGACAQSGVDTVRVVPPGGAAFDVACLYAGVQGVAIDGVPAGRQTFRLIGHRGDVAVFDSSVAIDVYGGIGNDAVATLVGVPGKIDLLADLLYGTPPAYYDSCAAAGSPNLTVEVKDVFGTRVATATAGCAGALPAPVLVGNLDLDDYKVRVQGKRLSDDALVFDSCWLDLAHFGDQIGAGAFVANLFTLPVPTCTAFP